jgi:hypothetical protein
MDVVAVAQGLWRWTAPHPEWPPDAEPESPGDWPQHVGCVLAHAGDAAVFVDPLLPPDGEAFWSWADERVQGRRVHVLLTIVWHERSREAFTRRYAAADAPPAGVEPRQLERADETIYWLPEHRALVPGDRIIGSADGGLRLCPESWLRYLHNGLTLAELRESLRPLLELPVERVLLSHGTPVLADAWRALARALS